MYSSKFVSPSSDWTCIVCARNREWASEQAKSKPTNTGNYHRWILNRRIVCTYYASHTTLGLGHRLCSVTFAHLLSTQLQMNGPLFIYLFSYFVKQQRNTHSRWMSEWMSGWMEESGQNATNHKYQPENFPLRNRRLISVQRCGVCNVCICIWFNYNFRICILLTLTLISNALAHSYTVRASAQSSCNFYDCI